MSWCPSVSRAPAIADQVGGGATQLSHALNISRRHTLHSLALSALICLSSPSSMSSSIPMSSHSPATLRSTLSKTFSSGVADLEPSSSLVSGFNAAPTAEATNRYIKWRDDKSFSLGPTLWNCWRHVGEDEFIAW